VSHQNVHTVTLQLHTNSNIVEIH